MTLLKRHGIKAEWLDALPPETISHIPCWGEIFANWLYKFSCYKLAAPIMLVPDTGTTL
jgi:hypothetical protein